MVLDKTRSFLLFLSILFVNQVNAFEQFFLKEMNEQEILQTKEHMIYFYAQELLKAGLVENEMRAIQISREECNSEIDEQHFFHILSSFDYPVGYLVYSTQKKLSYLESIFIQQEYRAQGIGKTILCELEKDLFLQDFQSIRLYVFAHNHVAYDLYKKLGYEEECFYEHEGKVIGFHLKKNLDFLSKNF